MRENMRGMTLLCALTIKTDIKWRITVRRYSIIIGISDGLLLNTSHAKGARYVKSRRQEAVVALLC